MVPETAQVTIVWADAPRSVRVCSLDVALPASVGQAIAVSGLLAGVDAVQVDALAVSVWGRKCALDQALRSGDRIELTRALRVDPKVARRERFGRQGPGTAGLFKKRRKDAKPGY
ncbi:MAG: hypothetical protein Fur007_20950 [Rhodoferax sp.]